MAISITAGTSNANLKTYEPILQELLFQNKTLKKELVAFDEDVKAATEITEVSTSVSMQAYTSGAPTSAGSQTSTGTVITPTKVMFYNEFDPNTLRGSRYGRSMGKGAWKTASTEFESVVLGLYGNKVSYAVESNFWNGITSATQTAIAALTPGTGQGSAGAAEQTYAASLTAGQIDGVVTRMIYNGGTVGGRYKILGTTLSASNIKAQMDLVYAAINPVVLAQTDEMPTIFVPYNVIQMIKQYNNVATNFKDVFIIENPGVNERISFYGLVIEAVPLPSNCIIAARKSHILWATDLLSDINYMKIDVIANNRDDMFIKQVFTMFAHVMNQSNNVLYLG